MSSSNTAYKVTLKWMSTAATPYFQFAFTYFSSMSGDGKTQTVNLRPYGASSGNVTDSAVEIGTFNTSHSAISTVTFAVNDQGLRTLTFVTASSTVVWTEIA